MNQDERRLTDLKQGSLLVLENVFVRAYGKAILNNISMDIAPGEHWAIIGETGSGKTSLLKTLAGQMPVVSGSFSTGNDTGLSLDNPDHWRSRVAFAGVKHSFRTEDGVTGFYFQQRFNAGDGGEIIHVKEYLEKLESQYENSNDGLTNLYEYLQIGRLEEKSLIQLSSGETRRVLIAAALIKNPELLLLDMPLTGLDTEGKQTFEKLLHYLKSRKISVVLTTVPSQIPAEVDFIGVLKDGNMISTRPNIGLIQDFVSESKTPALDFSLMHELIFQNQSSGFKEIIRLKNVKVAYGEVTILSDLNWLVKPGEKWALVGENGSGKSTLLSLINADHPQAYANDIILFDRKRGTGESIWDIKRNTGFVSSEFYQYFPTDQSCLQIIESGFFDTMGLFRPSDPSKTKRVMDWMVLLRISGYASQLFSRVQAGIQRIVLLIRALIKNPPLILLDEPAQGLDEVQQTLLKKIVTELCINPDITLIYVTHNPSELPPGIVNRLELARGKPAQLTRSEVPGQTGK